jgi:hypothetical protein
LARVVPGFRAGEDLCQVQRADPSPDPVQAPPMCIKHERSPAHNTSAPVSITALILSASIAADTSGFLIENVTLLLNS